MFTNADISVGNKTEIGHEEFFIGQGNPTGPLVNCLAKVPELWMLSGWAVGPASAAQDWLML